MQKTPPEGSQSEGWSPRPAHPPALRIRGLMEGADGRGWWKGLAVSLGNPPLGSRASPAQTASSSSSCGPSGIAGPPGPPSTTLTSTIWEFQLNVKFFPSKF